jgi:hypothetical protein
MAIARADAQLRVDSPSTPVSFAPSEPPVTPNEDRSEGSPPDGFRFGRVRPMPNGPKYRPGRVVHGYPIQQGKIQRPPLRAATLHRAHLVAWLNEHVRRRLVLVVAEAGYGKTTLLADWARTAPTRVAWFRMDEDDANWVKCEVCSHSVGPDRLSGPPSIQTSSTQPRSTTTV